MKAKEREVWLDLRGVGDGVMSGNRYPEQSSPNTQLVLATGVKIIVDPLCFLKELYLKPQLEN